MFLLGYNKDSAVEKQLWLMLGLVLQYSCHY